MLQNEKFIIKQKVSLGGEVNPQDIISTMDKFVFQLEGECDSKFAKKLAKLIETEKKKV